MHSSRSHLSCTPSPHSYIQTGYPQNLSGSDTDVSSTSNENLTSDEKVRRNIGVRQEPQGEETVINDPDTMSPDTHIRNLIPNNHSPPYYNQNFKIHDKSGIPGLQHDQLEKYRFLENNMNFMSARNNSSPLSPKSRPVFPSSGSPIRHAWDQYTPSNEYSYSGKQNPIYSSPSSYHPISSGNYPDSYSVQGITEIPKDYLDQSEVLKYLAKEMNYQGSGYMDNYSPGQDHSGPGLDFTKDQLILGSAVRRRGYGMLSTKSKSAERLTITRSHPDLSHAKHYHSEDNSAKLSLPVQRPDIHSRAGIESEGLHHADAIELLSAENIALKTELDLYYKKVSKLQKFELEIQKVHKAYEDLVHSSEKRERLERTIRSRLEMEVARLQEQNKDLREHLASSSSSSSHSTKFPTSEVNDSELRKELSKREVLIAQLLTQTKELVAEKERQEIELQAQRATLQEQRNHIDILDSALTNAQANVVRLEEESRKKQVYVDRAAQLQKALTSLQQTSEKRLQVERKLRAQHEKEVQALKSQLQGKSSTTTAQTKTENSDSIESLRKQVMEYEEKIIGLEAENSRWEQRYIEETTIRQIAVDAASVPKDAKIAALERTSQESEKLIAEVRSEKMKQLDELFSAQRRCVELESRIKDFESKLAEKDAMIKVLQQHSQEKDAVLQHAVLGRPPRHTRSVSTVGLTTSTCHTTTTTGVSSLGRVSPSPSSTLHKRTGSASGSLLSISSESSSTTQPSASSPVTSSVTEDKKSLDEQLKELDSRLSSKDSIISALRAEKERYPNHFWRV